MDSNLPVAAPSEGLVGQAWPNRLERGYGGGGCLERRRYLVALLAAGLLALSWGVPVVEAAPEAVPGFRAAVVSNDASTQLVEMRLRVASDDPNQDVGGYQYNLSIDSGGGFVDFGNISGLALTFEAGDGFQTALVPFSGAAGEYGFRIITWDGVDETTGCEVNVDSGIQDDYDACGDMVPTWLEAFCLPESGDDLGFNYQQRVQRSGDYVKLTGGSSSSKPAAGGVNLGGDTAAVRVDFTIRAASDALTAEGDLFFSEVDAAASATSLGDAASTGGFASGWGVNIEESGDDFEVVLFRQTSNGRITFFEDTFSAGVFANTDNQGYFALDPWASTITLAIEDEVVVKSPKLETGARPGTLFVSWMTETRAFGAYYVLTVDEGLCLSTLDEDHLGGLNSLGAGGSGGLEDFEGQGGVSGPPQWPGLNVTSQAEALGMEDVVLAWVLAAMAVFALGLAGFFMAGVVGAGVGLLLGVLMAVALNLMPLWLVVLIFLAAAASIVLLKRGGGG